MIYVVDAIPGAGKSTSVLNMLNRGVDRPILYITPKLTEVDIRVPAACPTLNFKSPVNRGKGKLDDFIQLVIAGENIVSTHALFQIFTEEVVELLVNGGYMLVIDEAVDCVGTVSDDLINRDDVTALLTGDFVREVDDRGVLEWNEEKYPNHQGKYRDIRNLCGVGSLYCFEGKFLVFEYPPKLLASLCEVYILTYLFNGSGMRCWLDINQIPYEYVKHEALGLLDEETIKQGIRDNLTIVENRTLTAIQKNQSNTALSKRWFIKASAEDINKYKSIMSSTVNSGGYKAGQVFWTTFKSKYEKMKGKGYTKGISDDLPAFLPCNTRATNDYQDFTLCMYAVNIFRNPIDVRYMQSHGVDIDIDTYSLSEMLQFIWRGCIRKGEPMKVLILSKRMKNILERWLYEK